MFFFKKPVYIGGGLPMVSRKDTVDERVILRDRALTSEISQLLKSLEDPSLTDQQRKKLTDQLRVCLDQLTTLLGLGKGAGD
jgi:hypothetical protein